MTATRQLGTARRLVQSLYAVAFPATAGGSSGRITVVTDPWPVRSWISLQTTGFRGQVERADAGIRTPDPIITSDVLYQLSYVGTGYRSPAAPESQVALGSLPDRRPPGSWSPLASGGHSTRQIPAGLSSAAEVAGAPAEARSPWSGLLAGLDDGEKREHTLGEQGRGGGIVRRQGGVREQVILSG